VIDHLLEVPDQFETVRDALGDLIAREVQHQCQLAELAGKDPEPWAMRTYVEHLAPWDHYRDSPRLGSPEALPIVNVVFDASQFDQSKGSAAAGIQLAEATYWVECYGYAPSLDTDDGGHVPADKGAAIRAHRIAGLLRKILMAGSSLDLGLPAGTIGKRWVSGLRAMRPPKDAMHAQQICAVRLTFTVWFTEVSPLQTPRTLERIGGTLLRSPEGEVLLAMLLPPPPPPTP